MTIEEAIKTYTGNAEYERTHGNLQGFLDFRQLALWLMELKKYRDKETAKITEIYTQGYDDGFDDGLKKGREEVKANDD